MVKIYLLRFYYVPDGAFEMNMDLKLIRWKQIQKQ